MNVKQVYKHGDAAYIILSQRPIYSFAATMDAEPDMNIVQEYMKWVGADHVLRSPTHFMFCETIPDVDFEIIE